MPKIIRLVMLSSFIALSSAAWPQCAQSCEEHRNITASATESVTADADLAIVRVGYRLYGPDAKTVYADASETSNAIMQALLGAGVPKSAIESTSQVLQRTPPYEIQQIPNNSGEWARRQFTVVQGWTVKVKPDDAAKTLNTAINAGANESGWIEWSVQNENALKAQASAKALEAARGIARQMAEKLNVHLGRLVSANEQNGGGFASGMGGAIGGAMLAAPVSISPLAINSRRVEMKVTIYAVFDIE